jgi:hypothetical protein
VLRYGPESAGNSKLINKLKTLRLSLRCAERSAVVRLTPR